MTVSVLLSVQHVCGACTPLFHISPLFFSFLFTFPDYDGYGDRDWNLLGGLGHSLFL